MFQACTIYLEMYAGLKPSVLRSWIRLKKWKLKGTKELYSSKYVSVFDDRVLLPNGREITYSRVVLKDFVSILPIIEDRIVMIEIFRYPASILSLEIPSGFVDNGENPRDCAIRELEEETGYRAGNLSSMGWFYPGTRSVRKAYLFLAQSLTQGILKPDITEQIQVKLISVNEAKRQLENNRITHAPTIIALQKFLYSMDANTY